MGWNWKHLPMISAARVAVLLFSGLLLLMTTGCSTWSNARRLSWVKDANPQLDCEAAINRGDLRFLAVNGVASGMVVGTEQHGKDRALIQRHGVRMIEGTSDHENVRLSMRASAYAQAYNGALLRYLHARSREASYKHRLEVVGRGGTRKQLAAAFPQTRGKSSSGGLVLVIPGESAERYRLDRDFTLQVVFIDREYVAAVDSTGRPVVSADAIDALLFGGTTNRHSSGDKLLRWDVRYNPLPERGNTAALR
jgi:hypothetical protein